MSDKPLECVCGMLPKAKKVEISGSALWSLECPNPSCGLKPRTVLCTRYAAAVSRWNEHVLWAGASHAPVGPLEPKDAGLSFHDRFGKRLTVGDYATIDGRADVGVVKQLFEDGKKTMCRINWETFEEVHPCSCVQIEGCGIHDSWLSLADDIEEHVSKSGNDIEPEIAKAWAWRATALSAIEKGTGGL